MNLLLALQSVCALCVISRVGSSDAETEEQWEWNDPELTQYEIPSPLPASGDAPMCRHKQYLPPILFELDTCAYCYGYMPSKPNFHVNANKANHTVVKYSRGALNYWIRVLILPADGSKVLANASDPDSPIWDTFSSAAARKDWAECCSAARACCEQQVNAGSAVLKLPEKVQGKVSKPEVVRSDSSGCPATWDGWQCWGSTKPGVNASSVCPPYIYFRTDPPSCSIPLEKVCLENGGWYKKTVGRFEAEWTDYHVCGAVGVSLQLNRSYVHISAYALSIVAIVPALFIFFAYRQLRVHRIILHQNLFISMLINGILVIFFKVIMLIESYHTGPSLIEENSVGCRILLIMTKYSRMTNYMWMFCEGYYLHKLIAAAFAEQKSLLVFYLLGWAFPIIPSIIYAVYRQNWANSSCWVYPEDKWEWVLNGPSLLSLVINALFLINIIRVLVTKLRSTHAQEPSQYRKAVRATLVLLPLFGLHFLVTIYRPPGSTSVCLWTQIYFYANDILDGIQGFMVALIFCYFNGEVSSLLKRTWGRIINEHFSSQSRGSSRLGRRQGSLGRSVVSTHVYSSVPPSPETNCMTLMDVGENTGNSVNANNLLSVNGNKAVNLMVTTNNKGIESSSV